MSGGDGGNETIEDGKVRVPCPLDVKRLRRDDGQFKRRCCRDERTHVVDQGGRWRHQEEADGLQRPNPPEGDVVGGQGIAHLQVCHDAPRSGEPMNDKALVVRGGSVKPLRFTT